MNLIFIYIYICKIFLCTVCKMKYKKKIQSPPYHPSNVHTVSFEVETLSIWSDTIHNTILATTFLFQTYIFSCESYMHTCMYIVSLGPTKLYFYSHFMDLGMTIFQNKQGKNREFYMKGRNIGNILFLFFISWPLAFSK